MNATINRAVAGWLVASLALAGCDRSERGDSWFASDEGRSVSASAGDAQVNANGMLDFDVTSDLYRRWVVAQQALAGSAVSRSVAQLGRRAVTQSDVDGAIRKVENDATAAAVLRNAGLSPAEYVFATISLEQAMAVAKGNFTSRDEASAVASAARNAEIARQHEEDLRTGAAADTVVLMPPAAAPEPYPPEPYPPVPPTPVPQPLPAPQPRPAPTPEPTPTPVPQPRPAPTPTPLPTPTPQPTPDPAPVPRPMPETPPSQPVPVPEPIEPWTHA